MTALGFALLLMGAVLVVAEAHVPDGALGVAGGVALVAGGIIVIAALGGGASGTGRRRARGGGGRMGARGKAQSGERGT
jgi:hypothetical protein